ncbi:hypothetical protein ABIF29_002642 [Bradyrhizobium elkanii]|uniref:Uncharacterized protein n=1 Tax=Bradyrhizobium elkanii TaxID=29448 RepID=A0ABV4EYJ7_BRAEL
MAHIQSSPGCKPNVPTLRRTSRLTSLANGRASAGSGLARSSRRVGRHLGDPRSGPICAPRTCEGCVGMPGAPGFSRQSLRIASRAGLSRTLSNSSHDPRLVPSDQHCNGQCGYDVEEEFGSRDVEHQLNPRSYPFISAQVACDINPLILVQGVGGEDAEISDNSGDVPIVHSVRGGGPLRPAFRCSHTPKCYYVIGLKSCFLHCLALAFSMLGRFLKMGHFAVHRFSQIRIFRPGKLASAQILRSQAESIRQSLNLNSLGRLAYTAPADGVDRDEHSDAEAAFPAPR